MRIRDIRQHQENHEILTSAQVQSRAIWRNGAYEHVAANEMIAYIVLFESVKNRMLPDVDVLCDDAEAVDPGLGAAAHPTSCPALVSSAQGAAGDSFIAINTAFTGTRSEPSRDNWACLEFQFSSPSRPPCRRLKRLSPHSSRVPLLER